MEDNERLAGGGGTEGVREIRKRWKVLEGGRDGRWREGEVDGGKS